MKVQKGDFKHIKLYLTELVSHQEIYFNLKRNIAAFIRRQQINRDLYDNHENIAKLRLWEGSIKKTCIVCLEDI